MAAVVTAADTGGDARERRRVIAIAAVFAALWGATILAGLSVGAVAVPADEVVTILARSAGLPVAPAVPAHETVVTVIRLPRVVLGTAVGAALALAGAALQGLFRNPLADPGLIGVSTGAGLAAATAIVFSAALTAVLPFLTPVLAVPAAAFAGGLAVTFAVYRIASTEGRTDIPTLLLAGVAVNAIAGAAIGLLVFVSDDQALRDLNFWMLGSLGGVTWARLAPVLAFIVVPALALMRFAGELDALLLGETEALHLGFDVERSKRRIVALCALAVGAAVALTGVIGFVGLVVPHLVRLSVGARHRLVLPLSAVLGSALLLAADLIARTVVLPAELPIGVVTSCIGGPFFLWLLIRRRGGEGG
ncbi:FecCD family ABC transporter permease [Arhodomonas aquaeolei]|uniref:FecCD family ABC transporter permease n=1 Tax=Arhodomonas aquaeolei TaxID=2369 RepID=UPI00036BC1E0|nr:iron chelate uptake ABC transporter family permease subunit [Arhodomonas aquaeolei]